MESRIKLIRKALGMTQEQLAQHLGIGKAALSMIETGKAGLSSRNKNILVQDLNVNPDWLDGEEGEMFNAEPNLQEFRLRTDRSLPMQSVPLYELDATAGLTALFETRQVPVSHIQIPDLPPCDGALYVRGDSMYPLLKSGDIVLYKEVHDNANILYGEMYLLSFTIDGDDYVTIKYLQKADDEGFVRLVSYNPHHSPKDIPVDSIRALALVKASVRFNTMG